MTTTWTPRHDQAYLALQAAAERVGTHQWALQRARRKKRYTPTDGHRQLVDGMKDLSGGQLTPEEAMALLHYGEGAEELGRARRWESDQRRAALTAGGEGSHR